MLEADEQGVDGAGGQGVTEVDAHGPVGQPHGLHLRGHVLVGQPGQGDRVPAQDRVATVVGWAEVEEPRGRRLLPAADTRRWHPVRPAGRAALRPGLGVRAR